MKFKTMAKKSVYLLAGEKPVSCDDSLTVIQSEYGDRLKKILNYKTTSKETYDKGAELLSIINGATKKAKEEKDKVLKPAELTVKRIKEQWKPFETKLAEAVNYVKLQMSGWLVAEKAREAEAQKKILSDNRITKPDTIQRKFSAVIMDPVSNTRDVLKLYIDDPNLIPREYLVIDETAVRNALKEGIEVPGARLEREKIIVIK